MNRFLTILAALALMCSCSADREHILKVYNWSDYLDMDLVKEFEQWYEEQTGEPVKVIYQTFDINETMLSKIEKGQEDFDVVCPSDYIIERMLKRDLLLPINRDFGDTPDYIAQYLSPFIHDCFDKFEGGSKNANDYAVGYMWGTVGIIYNSKYVTDEEASSWDIFRNPQFSGKLFMKEDARDVFSQIIIYLHHDEIERGEITVDELLHDSSDEAIAEVEAYLEQVKPLVAGWEADFGKDQMVQERGWVSLNWSGDGVWARDQAAPLGVDLKFSMPKEGFTFFFDGWVIPKYAQNTRAASYWINFMNRPDVVIRNVIETGYVSCNAAPEVLEAFTDDSYEPIDISYFFGPDATAVRTDPTLYPRRSDIERAGMQHDWGERTEALLAMWSRVKGDNASPLTYIIIGGVILAAAGIALSRNKKKNSRRNKRRK